MTEYYEYLQIELVYDHIQQNWHADIQGVGGVDGSILDILSAAGKSGWELYSFRPTAWGPADPTGRRDPWVQVRVDRYAAVLKRRTS